MEIKKCEHNCVMLLKWEKANDNRISLTIGHPFHCDFISTSQPNEVTMNMLEADTQMSAKRSRKIQKKFAELRQWEVIVFGDAKCDPKRLNVCLKKINKSPRTESVSGASSILILAMRFSYILHSN